MAPESTNEAQRLFYAAQGGDRVAFGFLFEACRSGLEAFIRSRLGPSLLASIGIDDVVQETALKAFQSIPSLRWQGEKPFRSWLARTALNVIYETARRERPGLIVPLRGEVADAGPTQSRAMRRAERFDRLRVAVQSLSPEHRQVVLLARVDRLPIREVARRMHRSVNAATQLLWRAMQKLKASFGETESFHLPPKCLESRSDTVGEPGKV